ncbi:DUF3857 domain-containing protein [bacterium]|nr:DUF3857 domain-containing protein [bacterium]
MPLLAAALVLALAPGLARADTITLRDQTELTGKIVSDDGKEVVIETGKGKERVARERILAIVRDHGGTLPPSTPGGSAPAAPPEEKKAPAAAEEADLAQATKLEREGLELEGQARFAPAMEKFEAAIGAVLAGPGRAEGQEARSARLQFLIRRCVFFWNKLSEHGRASALLAKVASDEHVAPYARSFARFYLAGQLQAAGKPGEAEAELSKLGLATSWYVIGSFDNERGTGYANDYEPETQPFDPKAKLKGKKREVTWRPTPQAKTTDGEIDLKAMLRPNDQSLAYAISYLHADADTNVALRLGSAEALKVWVNRALVDEEDKRRPLEWDQTHVGFSLKAGWNEVLLKVCGQTGSWAFRCRLTSPDGGEPKGVRWATLDEIGKTQAFSKGSEKAKLDETGAIGFYEKRRKAAPKDDADRFRLGYLYYSQKPHDENEHKDREALDEARTLSPRDPYYQVFYSFTAMANAEYSVNKEENKRRLALERALELKPDYAQASWLLAQYYEHSLGGHMRARELLEAALKANPEFIEAEILYLDLSAQKGLGPVSERRYRELEKTKEARTFLPLARRLLGGEARGDVKRTWTALDRIFELDRSDPEPLNEQASIALGRGEPDLAIKLYSQASALWPWNNGIRTSLSHAKEIAKDLAGAEADLKAALEIAPEDDGLLQRLGHLVEREGREAEGRKLLERALELNPNLPDLKKYLTYLDRRSAAAVAGFEDAWTLDGAEIVEAAKKVPIDGAITERILLRNSVTKVNPDGTSSAFVQEIKRVENDEGVRANTSGWVGYHQGEQKAKFKLARIYKKSGEVQDAPVSETATNAGGGEFARYSYHSVGPFTLEIGDVVELQSRVDDLAQSFFGDYFGADERFAEFSKPIDRLRFVVIAPEDKKLYVHQTGLDDVKMQEKKDEKEKTVARIWEKRDIAKIDPEPRMPWAKEVLPKVQVSSFQDWNSFAKWYWGLVRKQQEADESIKQKVEELTKDCKTEEEKIRKIYNFVVTDIRYNAAWEFGVHGFKPYNATSIFQRKFGDCKDKATLINTMLAECKIESYPVLIFGDNPRGEEDLSLPLMHHFNHCISYVPGAKGGKGMWLDGTAQYHPFDTLPTMDYGATTLIIRHDRGELLKVPFRGPEANETIEMHRVALKADGSADVRSTFEGKGDFEVFIREHLEEEGRRSDKLEQAIGRHYSGAKVKKVECSDLKDLDKPIRVEVEVGIPKMLEKSTGGLAIEEVRSWLFDAFYLQGQKISDLAAKDKRDFDVVLPVPSGVEEETVYELAPGTDVKSLPKATKLEGTFGVYEKTFSKEGNKLKVARKLKLSTNRISRAEYDAFRKFVGTIERAEKEKVLLSKEGGEE